MIRPREGIDFLKNAFRRTFVFLIYVIMALPWVFIVTIVDAHQ
jgi:hypothetical protein